MSAKCVYIFSELYFDELKKEMPFAALHKIAGIEYLATEKIAETTLILSNTICNLLEKHTAYEDIKAEIEDFFEESDYIYLDAFINICLEDI